MYLRYGNYIHPLGEPAVSISKETLETENNVPYAVRTRWDVTGLVVCPTGAAAATDKLVRELEAAYSHNGADATILLPDRVTASTCKLDSSESIGGVRVVKPVSFPEGRGAEGVTIRTFTVGLEAVTPYSPNSVSVLSFQELITYSGGGPRHGHLETAIGLPVKQLLRQNTIYRAVQQGEAVAYGAYPATPLPLWPDAQVEGRELTYRSFFRDGIPCRSVSWAYKFEAEVWFRGVPHNWTV